MRQARKKITLRAPIHREARGDIFRASAGTCATTRILSPHVTFDCDPIGTRRILPGRGPCRGTSRPDPPAGIIILTRLDIVASRLHRFTCRLHGVASKLSKQMTYKRASVDLEYRQLSLRRRRLFWGVRGAWGSSHRFLKLEVTPATIVHPDSSIVAHDHAIETHEVSTASGVLNFEQLLQGLPAHQRAHKRRRSRCAVVDASSTCLFYSK